MITAKPLSYQCLLCSINITIFDVRYKGWSQNRVKIFYLYNVKITLLTPSLPSIFTDEFSPADSYDDCGQKTCYHIEGKATFYPHIR